MELIFWMVLGMVLGFYLVNSVNRTIKEQMLDRHVDKALALYKEMTIPLECERGDGEIIYCYDNNSKDFVCQGKNLDEIKENFKARFPDHGTYIMHESLHLFPNAKNIMVEDPTESELKQKVVEKVTPNDKS